MNKKIAIGLAAIGIILVVSGVFTGKKINLDYEELGVISEDKLAVTNGKKFGYYDLKSNSVNLSYDFPQDTDIVPLKYKDGHAPYIKNKKYGLIDSKGNISLAASFDKLEILNSDLVLTLKNKKYSITEIDSAKEIVANIDNVTILGESNYLILEKENKSVIYDFVKKEESIDTLDKTRIINNANDEYALSLTKKETTKNYYLNSKDNKLIELTETENATPMEINDGLVTFIDKDKKFFTYELTTSKIRRFTGDYSYLSPTKNDLILVANSEGAYGYINDNEEVIIPYEYQEGTTDFGNNGYAIVRKNDKYGTISKTGEVVIPIKYTDLEMLDENYLTIIDQKKRSIIDKTGKSLSKEYSGIANNNNNDLLIVMTKDKKYGIIDRKGKVIVEAKYEYISSSDKYFIFKVAARNYQIKTKEEIIDKKN